MRPIASAVVGAFILVFMIIVCVGATVELFLSPEPSLIWLGKVIVAAVYAVAFVLLLVYAVGAWTRNLRR